MLIPAMVCPHFWFTFPAEFLPPLVFLCVDPASQSWHVFVHAQFKQNAVSYCDWLKQVSNLMNFGHLSVASIKVVIEFPAVVSEED